MFSMKYITSNSFVFSFESICGCIGALGNESENG